MSEFEAYEGILNLLRGRISATEFAGEFIIRNDRVVRELDIQTETLKSIIVDIEQMISRAKAKTPE